MTVEHYLTRELDIRFIDARSIATEARINLGNYGYPTEEEERLIREEACRIFRSSRSAEARRVMRQLSTSLEAVKIDQQRGGGDSTSSSDDSIETGSTSSRSSSSTTRLSTSKRRQTKLSVWPLGGAGRR
eukprot:CAMPEP_0117047066 /NCGR_PEP_ID=MMETSP0472-20121206/32534_1 /TAXON_ID=693140 ORGANISM="Tiarina fusus, Strain LIS" /NCGR_SAMPLE_ID=MMETSP0472 /ASSEMBLY_ACC=CAM_ASM_000603 /LENGTH=129 /DNA_ID=CAMNT_0004759639 /DNA_START=110 /DNA_END=499 /DNA_ORIENTATION=+